MWKRLAEKLTGSKTSAEPKAGQTSALTSKIEIESQAIPTSDENLISKRAYEIWQEHGCPEGRSAEHWAQAKKELGI